MCNFFCFHDFEFMYFSDDKNHVKRGPSVLIFFFLFTAPIKSTIQSLKRKACTTYVCIVRKLLPAAPSCGANHGRLPRDSHSLCGECFRHLRGWLSCRSNGAARRQMPFELLDVRRQLTPPKAPVKKPIFPALIQFDLIHLEVRTYISVLLLFDCRTF